jgi:putative transposase
MGGPKLQTLKITANQATILKRIVGARASDAGLVRRIKVIQGGAAGMSSSAVVRQYEIKHEAVRRWRNRWLTQHDRLVRIECQTGSEPEQMMKDLEVVILEVLSDEHRSGLPPKFSAEQQVKIMAVACEDPKDSGRPISHWTPREIADEVVKRKIVSSISAQSVGRFLKRGADQAASEPLLAQQ